MAEPIVEISLRVPESEFFDWNRAALRASSDLQVWVRDVVNHHIATPAPRVEDRTLPNHTEPLHWLDDDAVRMYCEYCGFDLDFTATRRKRFCSDICRVRAWRLRKRSPTEADGTALGLRPPLALP
jgi:hypothetical protein